ncbi:MAG: tRNA (adenosine(37)-N6)-dimethylallyltransferase MiaA [Hyphomicrobiaceae bacterium]|nr:tRNA (adenosine(37)-N6)-dimethylallyltransferase MiaA [Hyphomicrobiaceae bacterium]
MDGKQAVVIAGPTASGKSAFALDLARKAGGVIVNADSMQVYAELSVLTARPMADEAGRVPHRLYGHVPAREAYSVARWLDDVAAVLAEVAEAGQQPILVGGTGLYLKALTEGLSPVPPIPAAIRAHWRAASAAQAAADLHVELTTRDPLTASRLRPTDTQRIVRALEVIEATGRPLASWQREAGQPILAAGSWTGIVVTRPREEVYQRCDARFEAMIAAGGVDEVRRLAELHLDPALPAMRALGVPPLLAHLRGEITLETAVARAKLDTRHYVKRQLGWLRRNMNAWKSIIAQ